MMMSQAACLLSTPLKMVDAGAAQFSENHNRFVLLAQKFGGQIYSFEPNPEEYRRLSDRIQDCPGLHVLPFAVGDGKEHELKICRHPGGSSLLEPNSALAAQYQEFGKWLEVIDWVKLETVKLDEVEAIIGADFLKMDIQGAELIALESATRLLSTVLVVECEVNFVQQYVGQPLFSEIELFLRRHNFMFHKFCGYGSRKLRPAYNNEETMAPGNQWLWSDAVFIRNIDQWELLTNEQLIKIAIYLHELYSSDDFALRALSIIDSKGDTHFSENLGEFFQVKDG